LGLEIWVEWEGYQGPKRLRDTVDRGSQLGKLLFDPIITPVYVVDIGYLRFPLGHQASQYQSRTCPKVSCPDLGAG
jgi:hypothetical protein